MPETKSAGRAASAGDDERAEREQRGFDGGEADRRRHQRLGDDGDVEARAEVAPHGLVLDVVERLAEEEEAEREAHEAEALHVADLVAPGAEEAAERGRRAAGGVEGHASGSRGGRCAAGRRRGAA